MIFTLPYFIGSSFISAYLAVVGAFGTVTPSWFSTGIASLFDASGIMNQFIPVWPHPEMAGIVATIGLSTIVGFIGTLMVVCTFIGIFAFGIYLLLKVLPWNTQ